MAGKMGVQLVRGTETPSERIVVFESGDVVNIVRGADYDAWVRDGRPPMVVETVLSDVGKGPRP